MTAVEYNQVSSKFDEMLNKANDNLKVVIAGRRNEFGLVNDEVKETEAYKAAKSEYDRIFNQSREFAKSVPNKIKREAAILRRRQQLTIIKSA